MKKILEAGVEIKVKNAEGDPDTKATIIHQNNIDYEPKVSVIIPVYNVEEYLRECLDSVINQTLKEIEIICVDDGSTDSSLDILKEYAQKDNRFTIITQKNLNAGVARNAGLAVARGEYLSFLDSDDWFELNMLEKTYNNSETYSADITIFNCFLYDDINNKDKSVNWTLKVDELKNSTLFNYKNEPERIFTISNCWVWNRLFKTSFIKDIGLHFQNLKCANDTYFSCIALAEAKRISCLKKRLVHYRTNRKVESKNVTTKNYRQKNPIDLLKCFNAIYKKLLSLDKFSLLKYSYIKVATEHIYWSRNGIIENNKAYNKFCKYFCKYYKALYINSDEYNICDNVLLQKFSSLRNILVDCKIIKEIPKRIFYVWGANEPKREEVLKCINSWKKFLPDYEIIEINDDSKLYFDFQKELKTNEWFRTVYERKMWAYVADYIRIKTLYTNGGIYFDTDVSVVQNMDKFLKDPAFVGMQSSSQDGYGDFVEPAILGSQKYNLLLKNILNFYNNQIWHKKFYTMPRIFAYFLRNANVYPFPIKAKQTKIILDNIVIYPEIYFIPYRFKEKYSDNCIKKDTHTIHWWGGSWVKPEVIFFLENKHKLKFNLKRFFRKIFSINKTDKHKIYNLFGLKFKFRKKTYIPKCKISLILSVYNAENYVRETIESIFAQTLKEIEIICVNDGSTDNSLAVLEEYSKRDSRIKIINQKNQGLACSRNNALKFVSGEYVQFIDADDYIRKDSLELLYNKAIKNNLDLLSFGGINFKDGTYEQYSNPYYEFKYLPDNFNTDCFNYYDCRNFISKMAVSSCLTMYRSEFIKDKKILFPPKICFEDNLFFCKALTQAKRCGILRETLYYRRVHASSITQNWAKHHDDYIKVADKVLRYLKSIDIDKKMYDDYKLSYTNVIINNYNKFELIYQKKYYKLVKKFVKKYEPSSIDKVIKPNTYAEKFFSIKNEPIRKQHKIITILGLKLKIRKKDYGVNSFVENIFSVKNEHIRKQHKIITILGLKFKIKRKQAGGYSLAEKIFSVKNRESRDNKWYKVICILGIKFKFKNKELTQRCQLQAIEQRINQVCNSQEHQFKQMNNKFNNSVQNLSSLIEISNSSTSNTIQALENKIEQVNESLQESILNAEKNNASIINGTEVLKNDFQEKYAILDKNSAKLDNIIKKQNEFLTQYNLKSNFEFERCKEIAQQLEGAELTEKYKNLIKGLDENSIECVSSLLAKVKRVALSDSKSFDIFTDDEIKQIAKLRKEYYPNIIQLAENCYAYKQYLLPIKHFEASVFYYKHNIDDLKDLDKIKNKSIIDVGAFIGDSAIVFEPYTNEKIYAFEPTKENYAYMLKTIELNESKKIVPINKALGSKDEELEIYLQDSGSSINRVITENPAKEKIQVTTLDKFVKENNLEIGLIKVDIEGFEQEFLKGAFETIKAQKPTLLISIYHNASDFFDIKPMIESWNLGYKFRIVKPIDGGIRGETLLIAEQE